MLVLRLELHSARTGQIREIGQMVIANTGQSDTPGRRSYRAWVARRASTFSPRATMSRPTREGSVQDYPAGSYNVWRLVLRALRSAFPEER